MVLRLLTSAIRDNTKVNGHLTYIGCLKEMHRLSQLGYVKDILQRLGNKILGDVVIIGFLILCIMMSTVF